MKRITIFIMILAIILISQPVFAQSNYNITVVVPNATPTPEPTPTPKPILPEPSAVSVVDLDNGTRQITKTYVLPKDKYSEYSIPDLFEENGVNFRRTDLTVNDIVISDSKEVSVSKDITSTGKISLYAFQESIAYSENGYIGTLFRNSDSFKTSVTGTKNVSKTVTSTKKYSNLSRNDMGSIDKTHNGLELSYVDWYEQNTGNKIEGYTQGIPGPYSCTAYYEGIKTEKVATGYSASVKYFGTVTKESVTDVEMAVVYSGELPINPENESVEQEIPASDDELIEETTANSEIVTDIVSDKVYEENAVNEPINVTTANTDIAESSEIQREQANYIPIIILCTAVLTLLLCIICYSIMRQFQKFKKSKEREF